MLLELYTLFFLWRGLLRKPSPAPCLWGESIVNLSLCCLVALTPRQANLLPAAGDTASLLSLLLCPCFLPFVRPSAPEFCFCRRVTCAPFGTCYLSFNPFLDMPSPSQPAGATARLTPARRFLKTKKTGRPEEKKQVSSPALDVRLLTTLQVLQVLPKVPEPGWQRGSSGRGTCLPDQVGPYVVWGRGPADAGVDGADVLRDGGLHGTNGGWCGGSPTPCHSYLCQRRRLGVGRRRKTRPQ